jgi:probable rRNA maturation factor
MSIHYFNEDIAFPKVKIRITSSWIKKVISIEEKRVGDISFIFCSDGYLLDVNKRYLNHNYFTDIITFDDVEGNVINGDIFISVDRVKENSIEFETSFDNEIHRIMIHGVLHLLGYKDKAKKDKIVMTEKEDLYLKLFNDSYLLT